MKRLLNKLAVTLYRIPWVKELWSRQFQAIESNSVPWTRLGKPLAECKIALLTTGGVHLKTDRPFDMSDKNGDPSFRKIPSSAAPKDLQITHDYYDHQDADQDINLIFPIDILKEMQRDGIIGESSDFFYAFMGHIEGPHLDTLIEKTAPDVARQLSHQNVDVALLVPA